MSEERCDGCKFWECAYESIQDAMDSLDCDETKAKWSMGNGMCHRYPPRFFTVQDSIVFNDNFRVFGERSDFFTQPSTQDYDWCGEFKARAK